MHFAGFRTLKRALALRRRCARTWLTGSGHHLKATRKPACNRKRKQPEDTDGNAVVALVGDLESVLINHSPGEVTQVHERRRVRSEVGVGRDLVLHTRGRGGW